MLYLSMCFNALVIVYVCQWHAWISVFVFTLIPLLGCMSFCCCFVGVSLDF